MPDEARRRVLEHQRRIYSDLEVAAGRLMDSAGTYHGWLMLVIVNIMGIINGVIASERTHVEKGRIVVGGVLPLLDSLFGSPWRPFRRARRFFDAEAYVRKYGVDE